MFVLGLFIIVVTVVVLAVELADAARSALPKLGDATFTGPITLAPGEVGVFTVRFVAIAPDIGVTQGEYEIRIEWDTADCIDVTGLRFRDGQWAGDSMDQADVSLGWECVDCVRQISWEVRLDSASGRTFDRRSGIHRVIIAR
ncbi:MAG: hypothetical protein ACRDJE_05230 [Dehalococcoidia bacterium]